MTPEGAPGTMQQMGRALSAILDAPASLSRKMTLIYGGLVIIAVVLILGVTRIGVARYAERNINTEMAAGSALFDRIAAMRYDQIRQGGQILSSDFGFRTAGRDGRRTDDRLGAR